jgi:predicted phage terminase large subunit-like protein
VTRSTRLESRRQRLVFADFFVAAWHVLAPTTPLQWSWHLDELCAHLQAQIEGWAQRQTGAASESPMQNVLYTMPPGTLKSRAFVIASAWAWLRWPSMTMLAISGNPRLSLRDSMLFRQLVSSRWYIETFRPTWTIRDDQDAKGALGNTAGGVRLAMGWDARAVGEHVDWIQADDPHDPEQVESDATRIGVLEKWDGSWANRVNDLSTSLRSGIAQRTHEDDWNARRIAEGWVHFDVPMLFEVDRNCITPLGRPDHRTVEGESLQPARFTPEVISKERTRVGERRWACLYQGRPVPAGGAIVKLEWLRFYRRIGMPNAASARPRGCWPGPSVELDPSTMNRAVIAADLAGGKATSDGDYNVIVAVGRRGADIFVLEVWRARADFPEVQRQFRAMAARYPLSKRVIEQAAAGASLVASLQREVSGIVGVPPSGSKESRLQSVLAFFEAGNVHLDEHAPYLDAVVTELATFPNARHDDFVDALTLALAELGAVDPTVATRRQMLIANLLSACPHHNDKAARRRWLAERLTEAYEWAAPLTAEDVGRWRLGDVDAAPTSTTTPSPSVPSGNASMRALHARDIRGERLGYVDRWKLSRWRRQGGGA